jgi:hypothetical protein
MSFGGTLLARKFPAAGIYGVANLIELPKPPGSLTDADTTKKLKTPVVNLREAGKIIIGYINIKKLHWFAVRVDVANRVVTVYETIPWGGNEALTKVSLGCSIADIVPREVPQQGSGDCENVVCCLSPGESFAPPIADDSHFDSWTKAAAELRLSS